MSVTEWVNQRYEATASLVRNGVEVIVVNDPMGARFNDALNAFVRSINEGNYSTWESLVSPAKALRWRRMVLPQPRAYNPSLETAVNEVVSESKRLRCAVSDPDLLDEISSAASSMLDVGSGVGEVLLRSVLEVGASACTVIVASQTSKMNLLSWLGIHGISVMTIGELGRKQMPSEIGYVIGPPRFFRSSLVTSPSVEEITFLTPSWFRDLRIPASALSPYAEGSIQIRARLSYEGENSESGNVVQESTLPDASVEKEEEIDDFLPQPVWVGFGSRTKPGPNEVLARKVLLSGDLAVWLDDGERIRALDPTQPSGERVVYTDVGLVKVGTYLLLRQGTTERGVLYEEALDRLGAAGERVNETQLKWKELLRQRIAYLGYSEVVGRLKRQGLKTIERVSAWQENSLVRPQRNDDFELLLRWLDLAVEPTFSNAGLLRRAIYSVSADIRDELENAIGSADLTELEFHGHFSLDVMQKGIRGIVAARVLAISPHQQFVAWNEARIPFQDRSGHWLE